MTMYYVMMALAILVSGGCLWLLVDLTAENLHLRSQNRRLEEIIHRRTHYIDELNHLISELREDEDAYSNQENIHQTDEDTVRSTDQELHRAEPAPMY
jgi:hypothetical protein